LCFSHAQCILVDLWGHGLTDTPFAAHDATLFYGLIEALMDQLGWEDAHLVGYSFGAVTVAGFTAQHPGRVASMTLVAPAGFIRRAQFDDLQQRYLRGGQGLEEQARTWILELLEGGQLVVPPDWKERVHRGEIVAEAVRDWQMKNHKGHAASVVAMFRDGGVLDNDATFAKAADTGCRTLCILGELDDLCTVQDLYNVGIHDVAVVPNAGHAVVREQTSDVVRLIQNFWNRLELDG
jgi:pimeloyl-ACP methyl ester carboxylesterase